MKHITMTPKLLGLLGVLGAAAGAQAQPFDVPWRTIDGGGYTFSSGGQFTLGGTIGQPDAAAMTGGQYSLIGGFWAGADAGGFACGCDWNHDNALNSQDFFDYVTDFFGAPASADFNADGVTNSQDFFDFLTCFFGGCP